MGREYAAVQGYSVVAEFAEDITGVSGSDENAPELNRALRTAQAGQFEVLIVREVDRLSRDASKFWHFQRLFALAGVEIEYVNERYENDFGGRVYKSIRVEMAEEEARKVTERLQRGRRQKAQAGYPVMHGKTPYGYELAMAKDGKPALVVHEPEAEIVRQIYDWYTRGDAQSATLSRYAIARKLTEAGIPTRGDVDAGQRKERSRGQWNTTTVDKILRREAYAGVWYYGKVGTARYRGPIGRQPRSRWIPINVPPIVSRETWLAAQEQAKRNRRESPRNIKYPSLLRCRAFCANCGGAIATVAMKRRPDGTYRYHYYFCCAASGQGNYSRECDQTKRIRVDQVDATVWDWVRNLLLNPAVAIAGMAQERANREESLEPLRHKLAVLDDLIAENQRNIQKAVDSYFKDEMVKELLAERVAHFRRLDEGHKRQRDAIAAEIQAKEISQEQVETIMEFIGEMSVGVKEADRDLAKRRRLIEELDLSARLGIENGEKVAYVTCALGARRLSVADPSTRVH